MTEQELIDNGYHKYEPNIFDNNDCIVACFQKAFCDTESNNRNYFITWKEWDFSKYADSAHPELKIPSFEGSTQLTHKETGNTINVEFLSTWNLNKAEKFMQDLFATGWFETYD